MDPPKNTDFYFLGVDTEGHTAFAHSYSDFCKAASARPPPTGCPSAVLTRGHALR